MKVNGHAPIQQISWQKVANEKQRQLADAVKSKALQEMREEQQFEIYRAKGDTQKVTTSQKISVTV